MKKLMEQMAEELSAAFEKSGYDPSYGKVTVSNRPDLCEFQCNGAMAGAKAYKKAPFMIADDVVAYLKDSQVFSMAEVVKPGFINLKVKGEFLADYLKEMAADEKLSVSAAKEPKTIIIDYGGPNVAKPLHVGHLRSAIIGESIKRIGRFVGHKVIGDVHLGDWGLQMGLIITELKHRKPELVYFDDSYTGEYPEEAPFTISELEEIYPCASGKSKEDEAYRQEALEATHLLQQGKPGYMALWNHIMNVSVTDLKRNYDKLNVSFDLWKKESDAQPYIPGMVEEMKEKGYLIRTDRGFRIVMDFQGNTVHYDATNPAAREYVWQKAKKNYYDKGIKVFWLDEAEPEYSVYDFDNYRYHMGPNVQVGNIYPALYAKTFFDGMKAEGQENIINLLRCAWAGSQKYGALVWSGDIHSSFSSLRNQLAAGLNMGLAGIPWWTTDIGGFHGGDPKDPKFSGYHQQWLFSNVPSSSLLFLRTFVLLHHSCIIFQLFCRIQENLAVVFRHPFRPFSRFFLFQHIFNKNTVSFCRILYKHMRYSSDQFSILNDGTPAHPLNNAPCLFQQFRICHLNYHSFVHLVGFFVNLCYTDCVFFHLTINVAANPCLPRLYFLFFRYLYRNLFSYPASV